MLVARSDGVLAGDVRPLVRMNVQVIVEQNGPRTGYAGFGGRHCTSNCWPTTSRSRFAREALRQALVNLDAVDAPAGVMPDGAGRGLARRAAA